MSTPIAFREFNEDEYRRFVRTLSDKELIKAGTLLRSLCGDVVTPIVSVFDQQLRRVKSIGGGIQKRSLMQQPEQPQYNQNDEHEKEQLLARTITWPFGIRVDNPQAVWSLVQLGICVDFGDLDQRPGGNLTKSVLLISFLMRSRN